MQGRIVDWLSENLRDPAEGIVIGTDTLLLDEVGLDSLEIVELLGFLETEFDVTVPGDALTPQNFETVRDICRMVDELRGHHAG